VTVPELSRFFGTVEPYMLAVTFMDGIEQRIATRSDPDSEFVRRLR
jgi:hypothetical protein